jgi:hypothetical protein
VGIVSSGLIGAALTIMYRRKRAHPIVADISKPSSDKVPHLPAASALAREPCVFISYRREDSADITGRISDRLIQRFGRDAVFKTSIRFPSARTSASIFAKQSGAATPCSSSSALVGTMPLPVADGASTMRGIT